MRSAATTSLLMAAAAALALVAAALVSAPSASAQGLSVSFTEMPFTCDNQTREMGVVSLLDPNEPMQFWSSELGGVFSTRTADGNGQVVMYWQCSTPRNVTVTATGLSSGRSVTFAVLTVGPPDAPVGSGFDARSAPSVGEMAVWADTSPFRSVGVYISVNPAWDNRSDKAQSNLNASWVSTVLADGWTIMPIYVGRQAPSACQPRSLIPISNDPAVARQEGRDAAVDAVSSMSELGIGPGAPIYYDMEGYLAGCKTAVIEFLDAWTEEVHAHGYLSGVYGSRNSTMTDLSAEVGIPGFDAPDAVWVATGTGIPAGLGLGTPPDWLWRNMRINQFRLDITRTYGGVTIAIDENFVDGPVVGFAPQAEPTCNGAIVTVNYALGQRPTSGSDVILGTEGPDVIKALGGEDIICALGGDDEVIGGSGNDVIFGGAGRDHLEGGTGNDVMFGGPDVDHMDGGGGFDVMHGDGGSDRMYGKADADQMYGGSGSDRMYGGSGNDSLYGMGGQDRLYGDAGADYLEGSHQSDEMRGGAGADILRGHGGKDELMGQAGADQLWGGDNADRLVGGSDGDIHNGQAGRDTCVGDTHPSDSFISC